MQAAEATASGGRRRCNTWDLTPVSDTICGGDGDDRIQGVAAGDYLYGDRGDDLLHGGPGDDYLFGGAGKDILLGDAGDDRLEARGGGADDVEGGSGRDTAYITENEDNVGTDVEVVYVCKRAMPESCRASGQG